MEGTVASGGHGAAYEDAIAFRTSTGSDVLVNVSTIILVAVDKENQNCSVVYSHAGESEPHPETVRTLTCPRSSISQLLLKNHSLHALPAHLSLPQDDLYIIVSTGSGTGKAEIYFRSFLKPVLNAVGLKDSSYTLITTESDESIKNFTSRNLAAKAGRGIRQTVILLSGDGGIVDIVNDLLGTGTRSRNYTRPTIALFPLGTGNALFHSIHTQPAPDFQAPRASDTVIAMHSLLQGTAHPLPSFSVSFSSASVLSNEGRTATPIAAKQIFGAVVSSYGFHATLVADSDTAEYRKHGAQRFHMIAEELLHPSDGGPPHAYKANVIFRAQGPKGAVTEQIVPRTEHGYILATMVSNLEKAFTISPHSRPFDGKLRVVHFGPQPADEVMRIMGEAYQGGKHVSDPEGAVGYNAVESLKIEFMEPGEDGRWRRVCIDGLIVRVDEGGWMEVKKLKDEAIDILL